jgi:hypothetical protein
MRLAVLRSRPAICNETRPRRYGYRLRCLEPAGHRGAHRWTPELSAQ